MQPILAFAAHNRPLVHLALGSGTLCICGLAVLYFPGAPVHVLTIILGYLALALLAGRKDARMEDGICPKCGTAPVFRKLEN